MALYILLPYLQIDQRSGRWQFPYSDLYRDSWNNYFLDWLYTGIYWTLVWTCASLFKAIGIDAIQTLITKPSFVAITTGCMSGLGVALAKEHTQTITRKSGSVLDLAYLTAKPTILRPALPALSLSKDLW
ncbi:MAG: hypothetical protein U0236_03915 [Nitrospira sp.]